MGHKAAVWPSGKGATLSENNVMKEYELTGDDLEAGVKAGRLRFLLQYAHGNPYYKFVRKEIEALVKEKRGNDYLEESKVKTELARIETTLRSLKIQKTKLEKRKEELLAKLGK